MLTERQKEVLQSIVNGADTFQDVADTLGVTIDTVRSHMDLIYKNLDVGTKTQAVLVALRAGEVSL